jgi:N-acyl homoserine lactone hydrolase
MSWSITPLNLGWLRNRPKEAITFGHGRGELVDLACFAWLLRDGEQTILVDLGPDSVEHTARVHKVELEKTAEHDLVTLLAAHGVDANELTTVILTHLHWDHVRGLPLVPNATFLVQDVELRYAVYPPPYDHRVYEFTTGAPFLPYLPRMKLVSGRHEIAPGLTAVFTPGHSPGHQSLIVEARSTTYLLAGDYVDLHENWDKRIPTGPTPDCDAWYRTYDELAPMGLTILPGHDGRILEREVYD